MVKRLYLGLSLIGAVYSLNAFSVVKTSEKVEVSKLGQTEFGISAEKPSGIGEYNHYEVMYNDPSWLFKLQAAYYPLELTYIALGVRTSIGRYTDNGKPVSGVTPPYDQDISKDLIDSSQKTSLTTFPIDAGFDIRISPFLRKWMYFNTWVSGGAMYVEETLTVNDDVGAANSETLDVYLNKGWVTNWKYGISFAFNITQIDRSTITSIRNYGVSGVYFRPYYEKTITINSNLGNFDQDAFGFAFDFVSMY